MLKAPDALKSVPATDVQVSDQADCEPDKPHSATGIVCDLAEAKSFCPALNSPPVPVLAAFGGDRLHVCRLEGSWDLERAVSENSDALFRSIRMKDSFPEMDDLIFKFGRRAFLCADNKRIVAYASTHVEAESLVRQFKKAYLKPLPPAGGDFCLIQQDSSGISCHTVSLPPGTILSAEALSLNYATGSAEWHQQFVEQLRERANGLSIFEGSPGTGKTFYLRHLMGVLKGTHRFYFIPTSTMGILSKPEFVDFWVNQRRNHADRKFVVILEDSDAALMTRASDNREQVSAILNLSDGMLADFLRLQIICTINCSAADMDPALLRPGRLLCHRVFGRLDYPQAARLAESLGKTLPVASDYSLAEVFAGNCGEAINRPRIGFAAR
jgi:hypothetical protein